MAKLFISYRRKSSAFTLLLANKLSERLDADIFVDFASIDQDDFERSILSHLRQSDVFLLMVTEHTFADRIHNDGDWVRKEISIALERDIPIILVCENGLFPPADLPHDIREIRGKQGIEFYPQYFDAAVTRLVKFLGKAANVPTKTYASSTGSLPVPAREVADVNIEQSEVSAQNAQQILSDAIAAYDTNDYAQALFLFEALKDIGYQSRMVNIDETMAEVERLHAREEQKRMAAIDYDEIAIFARSKRTLPQALKAFEKWAKNNAEFIDTLDVEGLRQKLTEARKPKPQRPKPQVTTPVQQTAPQQSAPDPQQKPEPYKTPTATPPPRWVKIPDGLIVAAMMLGIEQFIFLPQANQGSLVLDIHNFLAVHWFLQAALIVIGFGLPMFLSMIAGGWVTDTNYSNFLERIGIFLFSMLLSSPAIIFILLFYDGLLPMLAILAIFAFYVGFEIQYTTSS